MPSSSTVLRSTDTHNQATEHPPQANFPTTPCASASSMQLPRYTASLGILSNHIPLSMIMGGMIAAKFQDPPIAHMVLKFNMLMLREAALAMLQSGRTGHPSKCPKLIRHTQQDTTQPSNYVDRHRMFSLWPSGQLALRTSYIPASSLEEDKNIPLYTVPTGADSTTPTDYDPWNEMEYLEADDAFGGPETPTAKKTRSGKTPGDNPMALWLQECQTYVNEFIRLKGRGQGTHMQLTDPRTVATFAVLELFHILSFESKISAYEFYHGLAWQTDNTSITPIHIVYQWGNTKALKHSGCGHNPAGVNATQDGDLAVLCPACPHLGKNLPDDWRNSPEQWKFGLFLAIDANFQLKQWMVSSDIRDPGLSLREKEYKRHLCANGKVVQEKSNCVSHNTVNMVDTKSAEGLAATALVTYRKVKNGKTINYFVLKFHLAAHVETCQTQFSFNWTLGVGWTDGEAPERGWANINRVASSTKEMGPGARRDTLNDHFSDWNWKKVTGLGECFSLSIFANIREAVTVEKEHHLALWELEDSINESNAGTASLTAWRAEIESWEKDHSQRNPFQSRVEVMTQAAVQLELAQRDAKELEEGSAISLHAKVTCSILISAGIDLEDAQRHLQVDSSMLGQHSTDIQKTKILTRRNALQRCLDAWTDIQRLYMPAVLNLQISASLPTQSSGDDSSCPVPDPNSGKAEDFQLLLPSEICDILYQFKVQHLHSQGPNTHARKTLDTVEEHLTLSHAKYASTREALVSLACHLDRIGWEHKLQPLKKAHLRPIGDFGQQTQGTAIMSWIWLTQGISSDDTEGMQELAGRLLGLPCNPTN
ncbi:hypothetical protein EDD22DRAFT_852172 [Suillus occidentalis]|nr:hypothetical protein EDD22DRAFT_852172 [Suillus occidentalis]